jgi:hypothetical protein
MTHDDARSERNAADHADDLASLPPTGNGLREVMNAVPVLARVTWFTLGALVATTVTLLAVLRPWAHAPESERAPPYEGFPFADNAGVCQEYVALAALRTSHADAQSIVRRLATALPAIVRPDNLRVVRAFAPGDYWTIAVDAQPGAGDIARAGEVATAMNAIPGTGVRFEPVFYSSRHLYDTAHVLCMPRAAPAP